MDLVDQVQAYAHAAIDISDGLIADLFHICEASGVQAVLEAGTVPLLKEVRALLRSGAVSLENLFTGGDDYQLLLAVPPQHISHFSGCNVIGRFEEGQACASWMRTGRRCLSKKRLDALLNGLAFANMTE
ncbi:MAG: AIR synthase-related protein [Alphaproteobacteria bacterium]